MKALILAVAAATTFFIETPDRYRDLEEHYKTQPSERIEMRGFSGSDIRVQSWDKDEVYIKLSISYSSSDERDEQRYLDAISLKHTESAEVLTITYQEPDMSTRNHGWFWSWVTSFFSGSYVRKQVEGDIYVPQSNPLSADVRYGSVTLEGMKGPVQLKGMSNTVVLRNCSSIQDVSNDYGKTTIERSGGSLQLSSKSGTITIDQFTGEVTVDAPYSNISVRDVSKSAGIKSTSATVKVERIGGNASIRSDYSNITVNSVGGSVEIQDKSGKIRAKSMHGVRVDANYGTMEISDVTSKPDEEISLSGQSGSISLSDATGNVQIDNPYGNINLRQVRGNVEIKTKSSKVTATGVTGDWTSTTQYSILSLRDVSAKRVEMSNSSGPIDVSLKIAPSFVNIKNEYSRVNLDMPTGFSGDVDLNATYGHIETNLPLSKNKTFGGGGGYAMGKMGDGNGTLSVETKSATLRVMQR